MARRAGSGITALAWLAGFTAPAFATDAPPVALGTEQVLSPVTTNRQENPEIGMDLAGNSVVVWQDYSQSGDSGHGVYAQRVAADGTPLGAQIHVNTNTSGEQSRPDVAVNHDGSFLVVWDDGNRDGSGAAVMGRLFQPDGAPASGELQLNQFTTGDQRDAAVASNGAGTYVVAWSSTGQDGSSDAVVMRRFDSLGQALGDEVVVNRYTASFQNLPDVAVDAQGRSVIVWQSYGADAPNGNAYNYGYAVRGQRFDADGLMVDAEFMVNESIQGSQTAPTVAADGQGRFMVVWQGPQSESNSSPDIYGRLYAADGAALGGERVINSWRTWFQTDANVAADALGHFVVTWASDRQEASLYRGVYAQYFDASGLPLGGELHVNTTIDGEQWMPAVALAPDGAGMVVWNGPGISIGDGSSAYVYGQRLRSAEVADLAVTLSSDSSRVTPGVPVAVRAMVSNLHAPGDSGSDIDAYTGAARGARVVIELSSALTLQSIDAAGWQCDAQLAGIVDCQLPAPLQAGSARGVELSVQMDPQVPALQWGADATVSSESADDHTDNDHDQLILHRDL